MLVRLLLLLASVCTIGVNSKPDVSNLNLVHWSTRPANAQNEWTLLSEAPADRQHRIILALKEQNLDALEQKFHEVSNPDHPSWLMHMTREEIHELTAPDDSVILQIKDWLKMHGVEEKSIRYGLASGALEFVTNVQNINQLFNTTMSIYEHGPTKRQGLSHVGPSFVPGHLRDHIVFADGLHFLPLVPTRHLKIIESDSLQTIEIEVQSQPSIDQSIHQSIDQSKTSVDKSSNGTVSAPAAARKVPLFPVNALYSWYNAPDMAGFTSRNMSNIQTNIEVVQFVTSDSRGNDVSNNFSPNDMRIYSTIFSNTRSESAVKVDQIIGPNDPSDPQDEASLDTQAAGAWNPAASLVFENNDADNYFYSWASRVVSRDSVPQVASISYGLPEFTLASSSPNAGSFDGIPLSQYLDRTDTLFMKMGLRGITVLASSGDNGANDRNANCQYDRGYDSAPYYIDVEFPASSPYVTAVGATSIAVTGSTFPSTRAGSAPICNNFATSVFSQYGIISRDPGADDIYACFNGSASTRAGQETAVSLDNSGFTSGGGFSTHYSMPDWQSTAVNNYVTNNPDKLPTTRSMYDPTKRAIPDISHYGSAFPVIQGSIFTQVGGTSLSAPLVGSVVTQLNAITRQRTGKTIGFINRLLYRMSATQSNTFFDITSGNNKCPQNQAWNSEATCLATRSCQGYTAATGWDAVTGLGVPNVQEMMNYVNGMLDSGWTGGANGTGQTTGLSSDASRNAHYSFYQITIGIVALIASFLFVL